MGREEMFSNLPPEIILNILSRIPIKAVFSCKCVCKSWLDLLESPEFIRSHLSKSVPGLLIHHARHTNIFKIFEFEDSPRIERHELHYKAVLELDVEYIFSSQNIIMGSANGLLYLRNLATGARDNYVCNPITRDYIKLPQPEGLRMAGIIATCGFGMNRLSNQYKVVRIFHDFVSGWDTSLLLSIRKSVCHVYTLGTESWRGIATPSEKLLDYSCCSNGKLLNGNLHWLARDSTWSWWISCFDLETEVFTQFRAPMVESKKPQLDIGVLSDRLCLFDNSSASEIVVYLLSDYGDEDKSWSKEYVISKMPGFDREPYEFDVVYAVKAFGDGDVLLAWNSECLFFYSNRAKTMALVDMFNPDDTGYLEAILYTPSFISLKDFETENTKCFEFQGLEYEWF